MGLFSTLTDALSEIPGVGTVSRVLGIGDTKADNLSEEALAAMGQSNTNAQGAYNLALQQAINSGAIVAPSLISGNTVAPPTIVPGLVDTSGIIDMTDPRVNAYNATAHGYTSTGGQAVNAAGEQVGYDAALARAVDAIPAGSAGLSEIDTTVDVPTVAPAALSKRVQVGNAYIDDLAQDTRQEGLVAARDLRYADLSAPKQFASAMDKATSDALAVAAQARGNERAGARREALIQMALKGAAGGEAAAATAAQENTARLAAYTSALQNIRGADIDVTKTQAQLDANRAQVQAQLDAAIEQGNAAAINDLQKQKATLDLQAQTASVQAGLQQQATTVDLNKANMAAQNQVKLANAANATSVELANAAAKTRAAADLAAAKNLAEQQYATSATGVSSTNAAATTKAAADFAAALNSAEQQRAALSTGASTDQAKLEAAQGEGNAARSTQAALADASNKTSASIAAGQGAVTAGVATAQGALDANKANINAYLDTEKIRQAATTAGVQGMNTSASVQGSNAGAVVGAQKAEADAQARNDAALLGMGGAIVSSVLGGGSAPAQPTSDKRMKTNIKPVSDAAIDDLVEKARAYTWNYKPGVEDGGAYEHGGWMAQDLEKSELGRKFVHEDSDGTKSVDMLSLAALLSAEAAKTIRNHKRA